MSDKVHDKLHRLFAGNERSHGTHGEPTQDDKGKWIIKRTAKTVPGAITADAWKAHLKGTAPLGVIPILDDDTSQWGSIDYDVYDENLLTLIERIERAKLPLVPGRSKSGGLHLFAFLKKPEPAADLIEALKAARDTLGLPADKCDIFPTQKKLTEPNAKGNWMCMPYLGTTWEGKIKTQVGLKRSGAEMTAEEFVRTCEATQTTVADFLKALRREPPRKRAGGAANGRDHSVGDGSPSAGPMDFRDGPPCLEAMHEGGAKLTDGRKRALFHYGVFARKRNPNGWEQDLDAYNFQGFGAPLPSTEVQGAIKSLKKKGYEYTCKAEPMCGACNKDVCRMRPYGVGEAVVDELTVVTGDPPRYRARKGDATFTMSLQEILYYKSFKALHFQHVGQVPRDMSQPTWESYLNELMRGAKKEDPPEGVGLGEQFLALLTEHLTNRRKAMRREDLLDGRPWHDEDIARYYFTMDALRGFFVRNKALPFASETAHVIAERVRALNGSDARLTIQGRPFACYWVPATAIQEQLPRDLPPPREVHM